MKALLTSAIQRFVRITFWEDGEEGEGGRVTEEQKTYKTQFYGGTASTLLHATEDQNIKYKNKSKYAQILCQNIKGIGSND